MKNISLVFLIAFLVSCNGGNKVAQAKIPYKKSNDAGVVAKIGNVTITQADMVKGIESDLYAAEKKIFDIKNDRVKHLIMDKLIEQDPNSKGISEKQYIDKYIVSQVKINDSEINAFIKERKIPKEHINDQIKAKIKDFLAQSKKKEAVDNWIAQKSEGKGVEIYLERPARPKFNVQIGDAPYVGGGSAKVEIVEFSDFQCPFCAKGADLIGEIKKKYGNKVKVAFKHFPLPFHKQAYKAAEASMCAYDQNKAKFWNLHDEMFANQTRLGISDLVEIAVKQGLDKDKFSKCLNEGKFRAYVEKNIQEGKDIGVRSTPTFYVNGHLINGAQPIDVFSELIDEQLAL